MKRAFDIRDGQQIQWASYCERAVDECPESGKRLASEKHAYKPCEHLEWMDIHHWHLTDKEAPPGQVLLDGFVRVIQIVEGPFYIDDEEVAEPAPLKPYTVVFEYHHSSGVVSRSQVFEAESAEAAVEKAREVGVVAVTVLAVFEGALQDARKGP